MTRIALALCLASMAVGCGNDGGTDAESPFDLTPPGRDDAGAGKDQAIGPDLVAVADLRGPLPDLSPGLDLPQSADQSTADLAAAPDLAPGADMVMNGDMAMSADLKTAADLAPGLDMAFAKDLAGDMVPLVDLAKPDLTGADLSPGPDMKPLPPTKWVPTSGPLGGAVTAVSVSPSGRRFATSGGVVFRRGSMEASWQWSGAGLWGGGSSQMGFAPNGDIFYSTYDNIFRSTDLGATWTPIYWTAVGDHVESLAVDGNGRIFATVARSANGMTTYDILRSSKADVLVLEQRASATVTGSSVAGFALADDVVLVAMAKLGVYRSTDGGDTFAAVTDGLPDGAVYRLALSGTTAYAATELGLYKSTDSGAHWKATALKGFVAGVVVDSTGHIIAHQGGTTYSRSVDGGAHFVTLMAPVASETVSIGPDDRLYLAATRGEGVYAANKDAPIFFDINDGLRMQTVVALAARTDAGAIGKNGDLFASAAAGGVWRSTDGGATWESVVSLPSPTFRTIAVSPQDAIYIGSTGNLIEASLDGGKSFVPLTNHPTFKGVLDIAFGASKGIVIVGSGNGVFRSTDSGQTFAAVAGAPSTANRFATADNGDLLVAAADGLYRSPDDGLTFKKLGLTAVSYVAVGPDGTIYTVSSGVFQSSTDGGGTWKMLPPIRPPLGFGVDGSMYGSYGVSGDKTKKLAPHFGVFRSVDGGATRVELSAGLDVTTVYAFTVDKVGNVFGGTQTGVYRAAH